MRVQLVITSDLQQLGIFLQISHQRLILQIYADGKKIWAVTGKKLQEVTKEFVEILKILEKELGDKPYLGGQNFGFVDLALIPYYSWFHSYETLGNFSLEVECPKIIAWAKRCLQRESVSKSLQDGKEIFQFVSEVRKRLDEANIRRNSGSASGGSKCQESKVGRAKL